MKSRQNKTAMTDNCVCFSPGIGPLGHMVPEICRLAEAMLTKILCQTRAENIQVGVADNDSKSIFYSSVMNGLQEL